MAPYFPFVVTSIDVESDPSKDASAIVAQYGPGAKAIMFSGKIQADLKDPDAVVLLDVQQETKEDEDGKNVHMFYGVEVPMEKFKAEIKKTGKSFFAYVHGFQTEPEDSFATCHEIQSYPDFPRTVIPVIWPSVGALKTHEYLTSDKYNKEQAITKAAGEAFSVTAELGSESEVNLALMCHSMGNRCFFSFASQQSLDPIKRFDRIFMVAADVWEEVYNTRVIEKHKWPPQISFNEWGDTGLKVVRMLKENGKVHCIHNPKDLALAGSIVENWRKRIGVFGIKAQNDRDRVHEECKEFIQDFDMSSTEESKKQADEAMANHCYQSAPCVIEYYMEHL
mmetsp:Transcript_10879/g.16243  ORF Transcript_10879/g.16243 Transcript_10879/m.16243 type:complete len:337 (+) Transcript_10879:62-1072(+)